jgi:hypothetical protein
VHEARQTRGTPHHTTPKTRRNSAVNVKKISQLKPHHATPKTRRNSAVNVKKNISTETTPHHTKNKGKQRCEFKKKYLN